MSETIDEELLGGEDLDDDYDITDEREAALLQDDDYSGRKKEEDYDEPDVLDLDLDVDIEEDFEEEKHEYGEDEEEKTKRHVVAEEKPVQSAPRAPTPPKAINIGRRPGPPVKRTQAPQNAKNMRGIKNDKWRRGNGRNFQSRQRRRNGTVLINPRYEGTVHVHDNARLAWDSPQHSQPAPYVQPWSSGNTLGNCDTSLLVTNIMTGIANTLAHTPPNIMLSAPQAPSQNFYEPPPNTYEPRLAFEPPPKIAETRPMKPYNQQGSGWDYSKCDQMLPSSNSFGRNNQEYNYSGPRMQGTPPRPYNSYSNYGNYDNSHGLPLKRPPNPPMQYDNKNLPYKYDSGPNYSSYSQQNNFQNRNVGYLRNEYQNKNYSSNYDTKERNYNYTLPSYDQNNLRNVKPDNQNFRQSQSVNQFQNSTQMGFRKDFNKPANLRPNFSPQKENCTTNDNSKQENRRVVGATTVKPEVPEKKTRIAETEPVQEKSQNVEQDEDEETRLYRLKIEEQKRERERVLKAKEERRKQMLAQKQQKDENNLIIPEVSKPNYTKTNKPQLVKTNRGPAQTQHPPPLLPKVLSSDFSHDSADLNLTFKVSNVQSVKNPPKTETSGFMTNRVVVVKSKNPKSGILANSEPAKPPESNEGLSAFFNNRKVLKKDQGLLNTRLVVVNNLSTGVTHDKLMALSRGIGEIEKLRVDKQERQATILFKSVASAHAFFKKYQRRILDDLSVIEVKLEPML